MLNHSVWERFGTRGVFRTQGALAAFLKGGEPNDALPSMDDFRQDGDYAVNPHNLPLDAEYLETMLLVRIAAAWGRDALVRTSLACAHVQKAAEQHKRSEHSERKGNALSAATAFACDPSVQTRERAEFAAKSCRETYAPFECEPDSVRAVAVWRDLGAYWFAAETAAADYSLYEWDKVVDAKHREAASSPTWGARNSTWPQRAAEAAAAWSSFIAVRRAIVNELVDWAK